MITVQMISAFKRRLGAQYFEVDVYKWIELMIMSAKYTPDCVQIYA